MRDERCEEGEEVISRKTIEDSIDGENAEAYRIVLDGEKVGGVVLRIDKVAAKGELELLFVLPEVHSKGIGQAAWKAVEAMHPEIKVCPLLREPMRVPYCRILEQVPARSGRSGGRGGQLEHGR